MEFFPSFHGEEGEDASDFLDKFELACLMLGQDNERAKLRIFSQCLKTGAKNWYNSISKPIKEDWGFLVQSFPDRYLPKESIEDLLETLRWLHQEDIQSYEAYERSFLLSLSCLDQSLARNEKLPYMIVKQFFNDGLFWPLQKKVICKEPNNFKEALQVARQKYQSLMFKLYHEKVRPSEEDYHRY